MTQYCYSLISTVQSLEPEETVVFNTFGNGVIVDEYLWKWHNFTHSSGSAINGVVLKSIYQFNLISVLLQSRVDLI